MPEIALDLRNIQGFVVRGYRLPFAAYIFLAFDDPAGARAWVREMTDEVLSAEPWERKPDSGLNLAFSFPGLRALEVSMESLAGFPAEFREGMASRAKRLGDVGESAPPGWESPFGDSEVHALVMISAADGDALAAHDRRVRDAVERAHGVRVVGDQSGAALPLGREHFGYADGFGQPAIEGAGVPALPGQGAVADEGGWRAIRAGEFILGYPDEENALPAAPAPDALSANGSYLAYRKLRQHVGRFRDQLEAAGRLYPGGEELLSAKLVGRWKDGTPLERSPERPDAALAEDPQRNNAFDYRGADDGRRCPVGAHIRRVNPRNGVPFEGKLVNRHRMIRRGIPYGPPLAPGEPDDERTDRGIVFMCLQASLARQFEFVQSQWINDGNLFRLGDDRDPLLGAHDGTGKMTVQGSPPFLMGPLSRVVTVRGGEYFFVPGLNGLHFIGVGSDPTTPSRSAPPSAPAARRGGAR
ncbi:MAG: Dyp-type peroxidase [Actinomycetota bacterium]|nr:Dyp-type peroxidase [Actinomycetota bacterium]